MFKNLFKLFLLNKLLGNGGGRRRGGIGCLGVVLILAILYFIYWFISG
ncbi:hypothetical protein Q0590_08890 [Rhodocytophaga aerolata]|uniref:Uncharacterized protein n=1 Tax=Rhodocytophaga aerolata TaxID=455078 RepID=A0ABT8R4M8_9BACT|nr:hypothetical protein [Rhodocytophaga aerolata]MDO1446364.1 hypothetical protein [Rhodocytophaga aerolata]